MRKPRDYHQEYVRRNERAQSERHGFTGYGQQRGYRERANKWAAGVAERMAETGLFDMALWEDQTMDELMEHESDFWEVFRNNYGKGTGPA